MKVVFMGTPEFAVPSLDALDRSHDVLAVYTRPDAASGRGRALRPSPVKEAALARGLNVCQPKTLRDEREIAHLCELAPDVIVVAAYGLILPAGVLDIPPLGCINVHASLLPRWRGAAPIQRAILAGDSVTGISIMQMEEGLDTGPVALTEEVLTDGLDALELTAVLARRGAALLLVALQRLSEATLVWQRQNDELATYAEKITKSDVALSPSLSVAENLARVRASSDSAPARLALAGKTVRVLAARESGASASGEDQQDKYAVAAPGEVLKSKREVILGCLDGTFVLTRVKPEGKGEMDARSWTRGLPDEPHRWEAVSS